MNVTEKCRKVMKNISKFKITSNKEKKIKKSKNVEFSKLWGALDPPRPFLKKNIIVIFVVSATRNVKIGYRRKNR